MRSKIFVLLIAMLLVFSTVANAASPTVNEKKQELNEVQANMEKTKSQLEQVKKEQVQVSNQLKKIEQELIQKENKLEETEKQLADIQFELETTNKELQVAIKKAEEHRKAMGERLAAIYVITPTSIIELLLEAKSINEIIDRFYMLVKMQEYDQNMLIELKELEDEIAEKKETLELEEKRVQELRDDIIRQKQEIENKLQERQKLLERLEDQQAAYEDDLDELEKVSKDIERKIQELLREEERKREEARKKAEAQKREQSRASEQTRSNGTSQQESPKYTGGKLAWPVPGFYRITSPFGYRIHPVTGQKKLHTGVDVGSNYNNGNRQSIYGQDFVAMADGEVILASEYGGYGYCVIINHGGGMTTLYAHGSRILVKVGDKVTRNQPVMKVGNTGTSTGAHAHFEVRINGVPQDPMQYIN